MKLHSGAENGSITVKAVLQAPLLCVLTTRPPFPRPRAFKGRSGLVLWSDTRVSQDTDAPLEGIRAPANDDNNAASHNNLCLLVSDLAVRDADGCQTRIPGSEGHVGQQQVAGTQNTRPRASQEEARWTYAIGCLYNGCLKQNEATASPKTRVK